MPSDHARIVNPSSANRIKRSNFVLFAFCLLSSPCHHHSSRPVRRGFRGALPILLPYLSMGGRACCHSGGSDARAQRGPYMLDPPSSDGPSGRILNLSRPCLTSSVAKVKRRMQRWRLAVNHTGQATSHAGGHELRWSDVDMKALLHSAALRCQLRFQRNGRPL
jgi:hypothetical protein